MNKKKICSIMLSFVMTMSVLSSFHGTVMADPVDPQQPDTVASEEQDAQKQEEQEPEKKQEPEQKQEPEKQPEQDSQQQDPQQQEPEAQQPEQEPEDDKSQQDAGPKRGAGTKNAPEIDISAWPEASFTISPEPNTFYHGGYLDVNCDFSGSGILFGRVGEKVLTQELELNISRTAKIYKANGDEVGSVEVTNDKYNLATGSKLVVTRSLGANQNAPFTFAVNVPSSIYHNLEEGTYTVVVEYQATWKKNIDYSAGEGQLTDDQTLPAKAITFKLNKNDELEEGDFGNGLSWEFDYYVSTLYIYGKGAMPDYNPTDNLTNLSHRPWDYLKNKIKRIYIEKDITSVGDYAFSGITSATTLKFEDYSGLKTIGKRAFEGCGFTSLEIPNGVTSIGNAAFHGCNKISGDVSIPGSVTSIGEFAFGYCGFTKIYFPDGITTLNDGMFVNCYNLDYFSIPYRVKTIGDGVFSGCSSLKSVSIPESVTSIKRTAFMNSGIETVTIPYGVTSIESQVFYGCGKLESVTIPNSVTSIGDSAFQSCSKLETITIPASVTSISGGAFLNCSKLSKVYCQADPDKLTWGASSSDFISNKGTTCYVASRFLSKYESKFSGINVDFVGNTYASGTCGENINWAIDGDGTMTITGTGDMTDYSSEYDVPWYSYRTLVNTVIISDGITSVGAHAFFHFDNLSSISLPDSITTIGRRAFGETKCLKTIDLPDNLETIKNSAFCVAGIESITIPASVTTIERYAFNSAKIKSISFESGSNLSTIGIGVFNSCPNLESIVIPEGIERIDEEAFVQCSKLKTVTLPSTLTEIGSSAFSSCSSLESVNIPDGVEIIGSYAFSYCYDLKSATISGSVKSFGNSAFTYCTSLESVTICAGVTAIPDSAFYECCKLSSVSLPDTLTSIGLYAFYVAGYYEDSKPSLESITLPNSLTSIASGAFYGQKLRSITIPGSVTTISGDSFRNCDYLETVTILNGVTTIEDYAFGYCDNIKSVTVPSSVTSLGSSQVFGPGQNLTDIYSYTDPSVWISFSYGVNYTADTKLHVPADKVDSYRSTLNQNSTLISETNLKGDAAGQGTVDLGAGVHLYGYNLSLRDYIGVNFWFKLDEGYNAGDNYVLFTVNGQTQKVKVSQASNGSDGAKIFPCGVVAKEMTDVITAQFYLADGTAAGSSYTYTVRDYANYILAHQSSYSNNAVNLVKAILNYGATSQIYFKYKTGSLANSSMSAADQVVNILTPDEILCKEVSGGYVTPAKLSLILNDTVSLKLYFHKADVQDLVIKSDYDITVTESGNFIVVKVNGITPTVFLSAVEIDFYDANNQFLGQTQYSPVKYCKLILNQPTGSVYTDDLKRTVSALYNYSVAARNYAQFPNR